MTLCWRTGLVLLLAQAVTASAAGSVKGTVSEAAGGPAANAVVMIEGPPMPSAPGALRAVMDQRDQTFVPHVLAVAVGTTVEFPNHDPMLHNVSSASPAKKFDLGMYDRGETRSVTFDTPGVVRIGCNVHPKMEAFVVVHANPFVAVTDARGVYTVAGVPPGAWQVRVWHEQLGERRVPVVVREGQVQPLDVKLDARR